MKRDSDDRTTLPLGPAEAEACEGLDRRTFLMRHAVIGAAVLIAGCEQPAKQETAAPAPAP